MEIQNGGVERGYKRSVDTLVIGKGNEGVARGGKGEGGGREREKEKLLSTEMVA